MTAPVAYYNENEPYAAQFLRNLIDAGHIAWGVVDERSIEDVLPQELEQYTQCHFFAGVGIWSLALRRAGWPDNRPVWTGSCPCQPFSSAGKGAGFDDKRHLWPSWYWLIEQCRPTDIFGEQVASKAVEPWIDLVQADLEAMGYAFGCVPFPSAGVGAPHLRDRAYWVANADGRQQPRKPIIRRLESDGENTGRSQGIGEPESCGDLCELADASGTGLSQRISDGRIQREAVGAQQGEAVVSGGYTCDLGDTQGERFGETRTVSAGRSKRAAYAGATDRLGRPGPTNGHWRDADWLLCRDGKWRPVEPGSFPLADGAPARVGRLRTYGNGINAVQAAEFIQASEHARESAGLME